MTSISPPAPPVAEEQTEPLAASHALRQRLACARAVLHADGAGAAEDTSSTGDAARDLVEELLDLVDLVKKDARPSAAWLLTVALTGALPDQALVRSVSRSLALRDREDSAIWLLDSTAGLAMREGNATATLRVVTDRPVVDVDLTAKNDFVTGIQRVVRNVAREWHEGHDVELVVWTSTAGGAYRALDEREKARVLDAEASTFDPDAGTHTPSVTEVVVHWGVPLVLLEVPSGVLSDKLAAVAELSTTSVRVVGYDCIPVSSAETVGLEEPEKFGRYLELVKFADRVAGISGAAADEFSGFTSSLAAQGLQGPTVTSCPLPHTIPVPAVATGGDAPRRPLVVSLGTVGRRKNQTALIEAAEVLWREGLDFEVLVLGHVGAERTPLQGLVPELQRMGRHLVTEAGVSDVRIATALTHARCLVFPTLHEGFGLPLVEALSHGVPVITSDFGSTREIAEGNGGLLVDPVDVGALAGALRRVLTDDALHAELVAQAASRPVRSWPEYADDLWEVLVS